MPRTNRRDAFFVSSSTPPEHPHAAQGTKSKGRRLAQSIRFFEERGLEHRMLGNDRRQHRSFSNMPIQRCPTVCSFQPCRPSVRALLHFLSAPAAFQGRCASTVKALDIRTWFRSMKAEPAAPVVGCGPGPDGTSFLVGYHLWLSQQTKRCGPPKPEDRSRRHEVGPIRHRTRSTKAYVDCLGEIQNPFRVPCDPRLWQSSGGPR